MSSEPPRDGSDGLEEEKPPPPPPGATPTKSGEGTRGWGETWEWVKRHWLDGARWVIVLTAFGALIVLTWNVDEVKEDVENIRDRVVRMETMTEGMRGDIRDVHRDTLCITGRLDGSDVEPAIRPDCMP